MLPAGADRCAVARPGRIAEDRRALFLRLSATDAFAWVRGLPVVAYASATRYEADGRRAKVILIRLAAPDARLRERISEHAPVGFRWDAGPGHCRGAGCSLPRAQVIDPRTVRIDEGTWPAAEASSELRCLALAASEPEALEVFADRGEVWIGSGERMLPSEIVTRADARRVSRTKRLRVGSAAEARAAQAEAVQLTGLVPDVLGSEVEALVERDAIVWRVRILWEDLELAVEDERRLAAIAAHEERRRTPLPPEEVVVSDIGAAREQIELRGASLPALAGATRRAAAVQLRVLLVRTLAAHPGDVRVARTLVRLLLDDLHEPDVALGVAEAFLATEPSDAERWRLLRREALALQGRDALAPALEADGIVLRGEGNRAAAALVAMRARGTDYEWAEGAWTAASALERRAGALRLRPAAHPGSIPLATLPETLDALVELGGVGPAPATRGVFMLVRAPGALADLAAAEGWIELTDARGRAAWLGASPGAESQRLRSLGLGLGAALAVSATPEARVDVAFGVLLPAPRADAGAGGGIRGTQIAPATVVRLVGHVEDGVLVVERAGAGGADVRWDEVSRWIAEPLLTLEHRTFPAPEVAFELRDADEVARVLAAGSATTGITCHETGLRVQCEAQPQDPAAARRLVSDAARGILAEDARRFGR
jgi:hypothetical protein